MVRITIIVLITLLKANPGPPSVCLLLALGFGASGVLGPGARNRGIKSAGFRVLWRSWLRF